MEEASLPEPVIGPLRRYAEVLDVPDSWELLHKVGEAIGLMTSLRYFIRINTEILEYFLLILAGIDRFADLPLVERDCLIEVVKGVLSRLTLARNTCLLITGDPPAVARLGKRDSSPTLRIVVRTRFSAHY